MNISAIVFQTLRSLCDNRVYEDDFPQEVPPTWPAIRYRIRNSPFPTICGTDEGQADEYTVALEVVAKSEAAAKALHDQALAALAAVTTPPYVRGDGFSFKDHVTKTARYVVEGAFHPSTPAGQ